MRFVSRSGRRDEPVAKLDEAVENSFHRLEYAADAHNKCIVCHVAAQSRHRAHAVDGMRGSPIDAFG